MLAAVLLAGAMFPCSGPAVFLVKSPIISQIRQEDTKTLVKEVSEDGSGKEELPDKPKAKLEPKPNAGGENSSSEEIYRSPKGPVRLHETWRQALSHPDTLAIAVGLVVSDVLDIEGTQSCLKRHTCVESNPIFFSSHPSRARSYSIGLSLTAIGIYGLGRMKQKGRAYGLIAELLGGAQIISHVHYTLTGFTRN